VIAVIALLLLLLTVVVLVVAPFGPRRYSVWSLMVWPLLIPASRRRRRRRRIAWLMWLIATFLFLIIPALVAGHSPR
jgi:hypothetical protein